MQALWFGAGARPRSSIDAVRALASRSHGSILTDTRYAMRLLARSPLFAVTAVASLASGIAAATVIVGLADALIFQASPGVRDATRVVDIARTTNATGFGTMSYPVFRHLRDHTRTLQSMAATTLSPVALRMSDGGGSERVYGRTVSGTFFHVLQVRPAIGRFFRAGEDEVPDARPVVVLEPSPLAGPLPVGRGRIGRPLRLNNVTFTVLGVAEAGFENTTFVGTDLWIPMAMAGTAQGESTAQLLGDPRSTWHMAIGRLGPGMTREAAQAELNTLFDAFKGDTPVVPASHGIVVIASGRIPPPVRLAFGGFVGLLFVLTMGLLAIACSNVAGMLLARASARHREMATRLAMGASRGRLLGQMLIETLVLFLAAGLVAIPVSVWLASALQAFLPVMALPLAFEISVTARAVLFAAGISLATGVAFGVAPARHALEPDVSRMLHGRTSTGGRARLRLRHALVIAQVALALAMAITASLFMRTLQAASQIDRGFRTAGVDVISIDTTLADARGSRAIRLVERVVERLRAVGGVESVGHARMIPLQGGSFGLGGIRVPGLSDADIGRLNDDNWDVVSPDYFQAVGLAMVHGRTFTGDDREGRPLVAIVNQTFARIAWPGQSAVGRNFWQIQGEDEPRPIEVVGVAQDAKYRSLGEAPRAFVYVPFAQQPQSRVELFVKYAAGPSMATDLRAAIRNVEPGLPVVAIQSLDEAAAVGLLPQRLAASIAAAAGIIGIFLAALGLYGLAAFLVAQRTREIAIRMALGASQRAVRSMVFGQAARLGAIGACIGVMCAAGLGRLVERSGLLVGVQSTDPLTFGAAALLMSVVLFAASYLPARRASSTDPAVALRSE